MTIPEAGKQVIDSMRGTPALLAVIVLQLATLVMIYMVASSNATLQQARELALIAQCAPKE
jgi:hypothetical protein